MSIKKISPSFKTRPRRKRVLKSNPRTMETEKESQVGFSKEFSFLNSAMALFIISPTLGCTNRWVLSSMCIMNFCDAGSDAFKLIINWAIGMSHEMKRPLVAFTMMQDQLKSTDLLVFEKKGEDNWELDYHQIPVIKLNGVTNSSKSLNGRFCSALFCHSTRTDPSNACRGERVEGSRHQGWAPDRVQQPYTSPERRRQTGLRLRSDLLTFCRRRDP